MAIVQKDTPSAVSTSAFEKAVKFVNKNKFNGLNITSDALLLLHDTYHLTISEIANLLMCPEKLINIKLERARLIAPHLSFTDIKQSPKQPYQYHRPLREGHRDAFETGRTYIEQHNLNATNLTAEHLEYLYHALRLPANAIGQLIGRSDTAVRLRMRELRIERRTVGEARTGRYNVDFFKQWSSGMAWLLGLFFTDGCMHSDSVSFASTDLELLQKVQALLGSDSALSPNNYKGKAVQRITLGHKELRKDLTELGLVERKSLTMEFPEVPEEYVRHFIRGCWDGDGGFSETGGKLYGHYTSGSETFVKRIAIELFKAGIFRTVLYKSNSAEDFFPMREAYGDGPYPLTVYKRGQGRAFDVRIGTTSQLTPLYDFLYKGVDSSMYLTRKHDLLAGYLHAQTQNGI